MRACCKFLDYLLVAAMHAVEDANRQPAVLQIKLVQ